MGLSYLGEEIYLEVVDWSLVMVVRVLVGSRCRRIELNVKGKID